MFSSALAEERARQKAQAKREEEARRAEAERQAEIENQKRLEEEVSLFSIFASESGNLLFVIKVFYVYRQK